MSELRIDVEILKKRTVIIMSILRDVTNISLEIYIDVFYVFINKTKNIKNKDVSKENIFEELEYF